MNTLLKMLLRIVKIPMIVIYIVLLSIHFIVKDRIHPVSVLFYICPLPLIILFGLVLLLLYYKNKRLRYGFLTILLGISIYFGCHYFGSVNDTVTNAPKSHILFWNCSKIKPLSQPFLMEHIKQTSPEIIALAEAEDISDEDVAIFKRAFPNYEFRILEGNMFIGVKGSIESIWYRSTDNVCNFNYIEATINQKPKNIMISDVFSEPLLDRKIPLEIIHGFTLDHPVDVLLGDFNTPYESAFFNSYKTDFKSMHPYSIGITTTWPRPFPVLEIDHIWLNSRYNPIELHKSDNLSRHKLLIAEYQ